MAALKVRYPETQPLARLYFDSDCPYPGWYARYRLKGQRHKVALQTWDRADPEGARDEAAKLLRIPRDRVLVESP